MAGLSQQLPHDLRSKHRPPSIVDRCVCELTSICHVSGCVGNLTQLQEVLLCCVPLGLSTSHAMFMRFFSITDCTKCSSRHLRRSARWATYNSKRSMQRNIDFHPWVYSFFIFWGGVRGHFGKLRLSTHSEYLNEADNSNNRNSLSDVLRLFSSVQCAHNLSGLNNLFEGLHLDFLV